MYFTWDDDKSKANLKKHGVSFEQACEVFCDEQRLEKYDTAHSTYEDRIIAIGRAKGNLLFVVNTEIDEETIRIISARKATKQEQGAYYGKSR
ncbi:MAG: BrnT family toxin [Fibromonadaceae bacterium]|jgi:uncharacterized DUF497 family protein|nr:BrnT family toxin [Fibromonadaceae bacterium]